MGLRKETFAVLAEDKKVDEDDGPGHRLPRTKWPTDLHHLSRLDRLYFTGIASTTPDLTPSRSSSSSGKEIIFHGGSKDRRTTSMEKISGSFSRLSVSESEEKEEETCDYVSLHASAAPCSSNGDEQLTFDSRDVKCLIAKGLRPSPSQISAAERENPYPDVDLNSGWNRATFQGVKQFFTRKPLISTNKIAQDFAGYSLRAQHLLLSIHPDLEKLFTFVFKRTGQVNKPFHTCRSLVLSRRALQPLRTIILPPTWFHPHTHNLSDFSANVLGKEFFLFDLSPETTSQFCKFVCSLVPFRGERKRSFHHTKLAAAKTYLPKKRQCLYLGGQHIHHQNSLLRQCVNRSRLVVDDRWRKRMRRRAVNGGRWTDGTLRQDRLWAEFHWVLDGEVEEGPMGQKRALVGFKN